MTSGEMKFALEVESVLNSVPEPDFRQLLVETLIILWEAVGKTHILIQVWTFLNLSKMFKHFFTVNKIVPLLHEIIDVEAIVHEANKIFLKEQIEFDGDSTLCCAKSNENISKGCSSAGICKFFYDSAPSGQYGTMCYIVRGACVVLDKIPEKGDIECLPMWNKLYFD